MNQSNIGSHLVHLRFRSARIKLHGKGGGVPPVSPCPEVPWLSAERRQNRLRPSCTGLPACRINKFPVLLRRSDLPRKGVHEHARMDWNAKTVLSLWSFYFSYVNARGKDCGPQCNSGNFPFLGFPSGGHVFLAVFSAPLFFGVEKGR